MKAKPSKASSASRPAACNCWACAQHQFEKRAAVARTVRATGTLAFDERRLAWSRPKSKAGSSSLDVAATGEAVKKARCWPGSIRHSSQREEEYLLAAHMPASHRRQSRWAPPPCSACARSMCPSFFDDNARPAGQHSDKASAALLRSVAPSAWRRHRQPVVAGIPL